MPGTHLSANCLSGLFSFPPWVLCTDNLHDAGVAECSQAGLLNVLAGVLTLAEHIHSIVTHPPASLKGSHLCSPELVFLGLQHGLHFLEVSARGSSPRLFLDASSHLLGSSAVSET